MELNGNCQNLPLYSINNLIPKMQTIMLRKFNRKIFNISMPMLAAMAQENIWIS